MSTTDDTNATASAGPRSSEELGQLPAEVIAAIGNYGSACRSRWSEPEILYLWAEALEKIKRHAAQERAAERERCITAVFAWAHDSIDRHAGATFSAPAAAEQIVKRL